MHVATAPTKMVVLRQLVEAFAPGFSGSCRNFQGPTGDSWAERTRSMGLPMHYTTILAAQLKHVHET
jgi:hypothetical protein